MPFAHRRKSLIRQGSLAPWVLQATGIGLIVATVVVWIASGGHNFNATLIGAGGSLLGIGEYAAALSGLSTVQKRIEGYQKSIDQYKLLERERGQ